MKINGKFLKAFWLDTIGQEDKAHKVLALDTLERKNDYRKTAALLCAVLAVGGTLAGVAAVGLPFGLAPLALLLVSVRKMQIIATKKETPAPATPAVGLLAMPAIDVEERAAQPVEGKKSLREKVKWQGQNLMIQLRTRSWSKWAALVVVAGLVAASVHTGVKHVQNVQKELCKCPLTVEPPKQGKPQGVTKLLSEPKPVVKPKAVKPKAPPKADKHQQEVDHARSVT